MMGMILMQTGMTSSQRPLTIGMNRTQRVGCVRDRSASTPVAPRTWLRSARNFGKTRFKRFASFHFSTLKIFWNFFSRVRFFFQESGVLEELRGWKCHWQMRLDKLLPKVPLLLGRDPWRRGKRLNMCFRHWLGTKNDFNHLVAWLDDNIITWPFDNMIIW